MMKNTIILGIIFLLTSVIIMTSCSTFSTIQHGYPLSTMLDEIISSGEEVQEEAEVEEVQEEAATGRRSLTQRWQNFRESTLGGLLEDVFLSMTPNLIGTAFNMGLGHAMGAWVHPSGSCEEDSIHANPSSMALSLLVSSSMAAVSVIAHTLIPPRTPRVLSPVQSGMLSVIPNILSTNHVPSLGTLGSAQLANSIWLPIVGTATGRAGESSRRERAVVGVGGAAGIILGSHAMSAFAPCMSSDTTNIVTGVSAVLGIGMAQRAFSSTSETPQASEEEEAILSRRSNNLEGNV